MPEDIRYYNGELKGIFKEASKETVPDEILYRKKRGFSIHLKNWKDSLMGKGSKQENILRALFSNKIEL